MSWLSDGSDRRGLRAIAQQDVREQRLTNALHPELFSDHRGGIELVALVLADHRDRGRSPAVQHAERGELTRSIGSWHEAMVETKARACSACGHVQFYVETDKLKQLKPDQTRTDSDDSDDK